MDYNTLLDLATDIGYRLAMCGAETFRVEESINRILAAYGIESEAFAIPNCLTVSIETPEGKPITRMRRIGQHGNDLDAVERYSNLSRRLCAEKPEPQAAVQWLAQADAAKKRYSLPVVYLGYFLGALGFAVLFGGSWRDGLCAGLCGLSVALVSGAMDKLRANSFFRTILSAFVMAIPAYLLGHFGIIDNADMAVIGALMLLVPGLLFTNAMRDIIFGDINSGVNRIVQVLLLAMAIVLGTAAAWNVVTAIFGAQVTAAGAGYPFPVLLAACGVGCVGFSILFNIHGPGGLLCALGGLLTWALYELALKCGCGDTLAYFYAALGAAAYSEAMARIRKYPAISYLVVSIFPLIPGAGVYFTMNYALLGDMGSFSAQGIHTGAIAGVIAVAILLVSTVVRLWGEWRRSRKR